MEFLKNASKAVPETDTPTKIVKKNADIFAKFIFLSFNNMIVTSIFKAALKNFKNYKESYRPVTISLIVSKIYERLYLTK